MIRVDREFNINSVLFYITSTRFIRIRAQYSKKRRDDTYIDNSGRGEFTLAAEKYRLPSACTSLHYQRSNYIMYVLTICIADANLYSVCIHCTMFEYIVAFVCSHTFTRIPYSYNLPMLDVCINFFETGKLSRYHRQTCVHCVRYF